MGDKYKVGDKLQGVLVVEDYYDGYFSLSITGLKHEEDNDLIIEGFTSEQLDEAFDPNYKERKLMKIIKEAEAQLKQIRGEDNG